ncbi:unnamed protein product [Adineta ricciae]|uniref:Uncharacterized protein n=1 Tax=Adineta ricciae TaxID=249248 RepID=A0A815TKF5_ADIRI|nr:unnamed protein product [Adineta ricciae]
MMKSIIILCFLLVNTHCASIPDQYLDDEWNLFKHTYEKQYNSIEEEVMRRNVWEINLAKIYEHNHKADRGHYTYRLGMNQFGDMTHKEFQTKLTPMKIPKSTGELKPTRRHVNVPHAVDWRNEGAVTPVKNQGKCGSSWAFSATGSLEGQHFHQTRKLVSLSAQNLIDCSDSFGNAGCNGGLNDFAFQYIKVNGGIDTEESYPYEARNGNCRFNRTNIGANSTGFRDVKVNDENALTYAVAIIGPIAVTIDASQPSFQFYKSGVYDEPKCSSTQVDHCALAVGFNATDNQLYYIVKNSWGTTWGQNGYVWMSRNKNNQCGIATMASYPLV